MLTFHTLTIALGGLLFGLGLQVVVRRWSRGQSLREAEAEGRSLVEEAEGDAQALMNKAKSRAEDFKESLEDDSADEIEKRKKKIEELEDVISDREARFEQNFSRQDRQIQQRRSWVDNRENVLEKRLRRQESLKETRKKLLQDLVDKLAIRTELKIEDVRQQVVNHLISEAEIQAQKQISQAEEEAADNSEKMARQTIATALSRFTRPYCAERGLGHVEIPNEDVKARVFGPNSQNLKYIEKAIGVDLIFKEEYGTVSISGFDPVRRELGRLVVEKLVRLPKVDEKVIDEKIQICKKDLYRKIRQDGEKIVRALKLEGVHPECQNALGSLRYRYSYAQNQFFHVGEVGYLCGLLSSELGLDLKKGRRAGLYHDIGKSMDHSIDGGHAVIGADFIEKHGEPPDVVHAVRAHHYDETPNSDLAYLVIGADALSGARPGARRSTADSYMEKMHQLEEIGNSFPGVTDTFIMAAGREVRVYVDSHKVDDFKALEMSKELAKKIESEISYPGFIKVTVVRQTQAIEMAR